MWKHKQGRIMVLAVLAAVFLLGACAAPTATPAPTPTPTATPRPAATPTPTATPTPLPPGAPTPTPTPRPTPTPVVIERVVVVTATPTPAPRVTPTPTPTPAPMVVRFADATVPNSMDPLLGTGCCWREVMNSLYRGLVRSDAEFKPQPDIATSWEPSADRLSWTFKLRPGVKFHDGTPVDAAAVKFHFERLLDPKTAAIRRASFANIAKVEAVDALTVKFTTKTPDPDFIFLMTDRPSALLVSPTAVKALGDAEFGRKPVGAGPMKLVEWSGDRIVLERWEGYYGEPVKISRLIHLVVPEGITRLAMLLRGEIDVALGLSADDARLMERNPDIEVVKTPLFTQTYGEIKQTPGMPLTDKRVRQALNYAIDKELIVKTVYGGLGHCQTGPASPYLVDAANYGCWPYDPNKAKELLKEAGYPTGFELEWFYLPRWSGFDQMVEAVQAQFAAVGVKMTIRKLSTIAELIERTNRTHPSLYTKPSIGNPIRLSPFLQSHLWRMYHNPGTIFKPGDPWTSDWSGYDNRQVGQLLEDTAKEFDAKKRTEAFAEVQRLIWEDAPFIWLYALETATGVRKNVKNFFMNPFQEPVIDKLEVLPR